MTMREQARTRRGAAVILAAVALMVSSGAFALNQAASFGKSEIDGLRASVGDISRDGETISIRYTLQWTHSRDRWRLEGEEPVNITFWDATVDTARRISIATEPVSLTGPFLARSTDTVNIRVRAQVPSGAAAVSLALGTSGLETDRVPLSSQ
jgi:hypothetical protein